MRIKKEVLFIIPSLEGGGAEKALIMLLRHLNRKKYEIDLCVVEKRGFYLDQVPGHVNMFHLFTNKIVRKTITGLHRRFNISWPFRKLTRHIVTSKYDVAVCFLDSIFTDMLLFVDDRVCKSATVLHSSYRTNNNWYKFIKGEYRKRLQKRYRKMDTIIGVSDDAIDEFTSIFSGYENLCIIHNPIDRKGIIKKSKAFDVGFSEEPVNIVAVGNLLPVKGYRNLIKACALLKGSGFNFKLRILGQGPLKKALNKQIYRMGVVNFVSLLGFKENPYPYMAQSDIFVMSSFSEALPTALCEAMILGKPVVVTNCSGCRSLVGNGAYGIMTKQTTESLFNGLKILMADSALRKDFSKK